MHPETEYLLSLARNYIAGADEVPVPPTGIDWSRFRTLLIDHHTPCTFDRLLTHDLVDKAFFDEMSAIMVKLRRRGAFLLLELARLLPALEETDCSPVVLKGAALSQTVYPSPSDRFFSDLDILVVKNKFSEACNVLARFGYQRARSRYHPLFYERYHFHRGFNNPMGTRVELHWDLTRPDDYCRFDLDRFLEGARTVDLNGIPTRIPSDADQLLHAASQANGEGFTSLRRMIDAALLLKTDMISDSDLASVAERQGMSSSLWLLLLLTQRATGIDVPAGLMKGICPSPLARTCMISTGIKEKSMDGWGRHRSGFRKLLTWLSAPDLRTGVVEIRKYLATAEFHLLALGHDPERLPGLFRRSLMTARKAWSLVKIAGYQGYRLAFHGWGKRG